jgi:hypothetical protein
LKKKPWIGQPSRGRFRTATSKRLRPSSQRRGFHRPTDAISAIRWTRNHQAWIKKSNLENHSKCKFSILGVNIFNFLLYYLYNYNMEKDINKEFLRLK